mmetsp:Transcript_1552/g.2109  ORF Transcript_1552/g.2109 Transcript_1552/m.2109 type:complete len:80 (+) Transcript_1552:98-337(+)|eukprot:CAMPEP_0116075332 /NCGR_PEP_ID=MMETSP0322-20121206/16555_1 /TAXON_ID=163516 /ORGANISM="Leptocylindrus danicus var. apora, Strain B651" /LENGTH=79 /DNA_ID=CAMNT_0003565337 /DNA_START=59 /DNA_END=298 /DNA_ORIENTATION=-
MPSNAKGPDLKRYMDKRLRVTLNGSRKVVGTLRGYDAFLNVVMEEAIDETVENSPSIGTIVVRGNSIVQFESLERIETN